MPNIDFYFLSEDSISARRLFACRLTEQVYKKGHKVFIYVENSEEAQQLNAQLWTFRDVSFVPHKLVGNNDIVAPITIGHDFSDGEADILINLTEAVPEFYAKFQRILEIIPNDDVLKEIGRKKYKFYKSNGCELITHDV